MKCKDCNGKGTYQLLGPILTCEECEGTGSVAEAALREPSNDPISADELWALIEAASRIGANRDTFRIAPNVVTPSPKSS